MVGEIRLVVQAMLLPHRLRPILRRQKAAGAEAASAAAVAHRGDATLAVSHDPCTASHSLDKHAESMVTPAAATAAADPLAHVNFPTGAGDGGSAPEAPAEGRVRAEPQPEPPGQSAAARGGEVAGLRLEAALLEDMQAAVDFSRAAYGYAYLCGGISSIARYLHMQTVQRSTFDIISGASSEANTQALCASAGIPMRDVLLAEWNNTTYRCGSGAAIYLRCASGAAVCLCGGSGPQQAGQQQAGRSGVWYHLPGSDACA